MDKSLTAAKRRKRSASGWWPVFFIAPGLLVVAVFILLPLFMSLANSLFSWNALIRDEFVGLRNFVALFTGYPYSERFSNAVMNNVKWFACTMLIQNTIGLLLGYVLSRKLRGSQLYRRLIFIPVMFSIVAVSYLWGLYMRPTGLINTFLSNIGLKDWGQTWLGNGSIATFSIITVNIWRWLGFPSLVFMTAIDGVDEELIEAGKLDGAGEWQGFWHVIFPNILPSIAVITVLTVIGSLNVFEQIYTMAGLDGPPNYATDTVSTLFYRTAFGSVDSGKPQIGVGSAIAVIIYIATFLISLISIRVTNSKEVES